MAPYEVKDRWLNVFEKRVERAHRGIRRQVGSQFYDQFARYDAILARDDWKEELREAKFLTRTQLLEWKLDSHMRRFAFVKYHHLRRLEKWLFSRKR